MFLFINNILHLQILKEVQYLSNEFPKVVNTKRVGFAPILKHYFDKCSIKQIIDQNAPLDPRRKILTHGEACVAIITGILFQVSQLYKFRKFCDESTVTNTILPGIDSKEFFDDRLGDTLMAIFSRGIGDLELLLTKNIINITFGYSKKYRQDLKQFIWFLSASSDSGFPLFQKPYDGNTADLDTYVDQWENLIELLGQRDFLYIADSKLVSQSNLAYIHDNDGYLIAP